MPLLPISRPDLSSPEFASPSLLYSAPSIILYISSRQSLGPGSLYITQEHIYWISNVPSGPALCLDYYSLIMHALSSDTAGSFPHPCIFCQIETGQEEDYTGDDGADDEADNENDEKAAEQAVLDNPSSVSQLRFVAPAQDQLEAIFSALSAGAELNPDPPKDGAEEEGNFFFDVNSMVTADMIRAQMGDQEDDEEDDEDDDQAAGGEIFTANDTNQDADQMEEGQ